MRDKAVEVAAEVAKATPPVSVVGLNFLGFPISDWVQLAVLLYTLMQMHVLANKSWHWYQSLIRWLTGGKERGNKRKRK